MTESAPLNIFGQIEEMRELANLRDWQSLERVFWSRCEEADPRAAAAVSSVALDDWKDAVAAAARVARERAVGSAAAVYWEFDPDNEWESAYFLCRRYRASAERDDEWAADYYETVGAPRLPAFADLYGAAFAGSPALEARNLFLLARTFAGFAVAAVPSWGVEIPLCAGYHDQAVVLRITGTDLD